MRGLLALLNREPDLHACQRVLFVATADPRLSKKVFEKIGCRFVSARTNVVAPESFRPLFPDAVPFVSTEDVKARPLWWTFRIRRRLFDAVVLVLSGEPIFRLPKLWALFLNARSVVVYNENLDSFTLHRGHWHGVYRHIVWRLTTGQLRPGQLLQRLLWPIGILILLCRTALLVRRHRPASSQR